MTGPAPRRTVAPARLVAALLVAFGTAGTAARADEQTGAAAATTADLAAVSVDGAQVSGPGVPAADPATRAPASGAPDTGAMEPLWELGIGAVGSYSPDYPASDQSRGNFLPFPYTIYRGKYVRLDDDSARLVPVQTPDYSFGISVGGAFPARSQDNTAREGMPDLSYLLEIGPELVLNGPTYADGRGKLELALQGRMVVSMGGVNPSFRGIVIEPKLRSTLTGVMGATTQIRGAVGPVFASEGVQDYFYEVEPEFAQADRPAFDAAAGYLGSDMSIGIAHRIGSRARVFASARLSVHTGAANVASPLFRDQVTGAVGVGFVYTFARSKRLVPSGR